MSEKTADTEASDRRDAPAGAEDDGNGAPRAEAPEPDGGVSPEQEEEELAEAELRAELDHLEEEFSGLKERHLRLAADFENYRRRAENEMTESWIRAQADLVRRLLDALDDLERVTSQDAEEVSAGGLLEGVELIQRKLLQAMKDAGVEIVDPEGEAFDPETMEAMMRVEAESEEEDDTVDQVYQKGYTFKGHLVRPARVSVRKHD